MNTLRVHNINFGIFSVTQKHVHLIYGATEGKNFHVTIYLFIRIRIHTSLTECRVGKENIYFGLNGNRKGKNKERWEWERSEKKISTQKECWLNRSMRNAHFEKQKKTEEAIERHELFCVNKVQRKKIWILCETCSLVGVFNPKWKISTSYFLDFCSSPLFTYHVPPMFLVYKWREKRIYLHNECNICIHYDYYLMYSGKKCALEINFSQHSLCCRDVALLIFGFSV